MIEVMEKQELYASHFERIEKQAPSLMPIRKAAFSGFTELGFPTTKDEEWRYTKVPASADTPITPAGEVAAAVTADDIAPYAFATDGPVLVFVNGLYSAKLSTQGQLPENVSVRSLAAVLRDDADSIKQHLARYASYTKHAFAALNTALMEDGAVVFVPKGTVVIQAIHLLFVTTTSETPTVSHPRNLIVAEENSQVTVVETHAGLGSNVYFTNAVTEVVAGENAVVDHIKIIRESDHAYHMATVQLHQQRSSRLTSHAISLGGKIIRNDINTLLDGEGCECNLHGLYLVDGRRHVDNHIVVDHAKPHCDSREVFKGVLDDHSRGVFSGRINVHKDAQKTDAKQTNQTLLLSPDAQVESKPQLEIFADDVKCTHGATIGQVSDEAIFYLRSRGLSEASARSLLVYAFAKEGLDHIAVQPLRNHLDAILLERLPHGINA